MKMLKFLFYLRVNMTIAQLFYVYVYTNGMSGKKPCRFFNMWITSSIFLEIVRTMWERSVHGCMMYSLTQRL